MSCIRATYQSSSRANIASMAGRFRFSFALFLLSGCLLLVCGRRADAQGLAALAGGGALSDQEITQLCQGAVAKHIGPSDVDSLGANLGLSPDQLQKLKDCIAQSPSPAPSENQTNQQSSGLQTNQVANPVKTPEVSTIETRFRELETPYKLLAAPSTKSLDQFGYDLFSTRVSTFAPIGNVPVGDDYILGPDDELNIYIWGRVNQTLHLMVDREGTVMVPEIGPVQVAGLTFAQAKKVIEGRMGQITGVEVDVTMGQVRTIQVFVIGKVAQPGLYTISALSHVSNALGAAGGISKVGTLRRIELRRDNRLTETIDLYDMLLHGDTSSDVRLKSRDVIFVPVIGPVVAITGDVKSPAIYEMKGSESLSNLLHMAGGVTAFGYSERLQVERVENHQRRIALDVNLNERTAGKFAVDDGDLVKVFTVLPVERDVVRANGNVNQPGTYEWTPAMTVADLIREAQGPADHTFFDYALVERREGPDRKLKQMPINLENALSFPNSSDNLVLRPEDSVTLYSRSELSEVPTVSILGEVRRPGTYPLTPGMTMRELIYEAGGFLKNASRNRAELTRTEIANGSLTKYLHLDVDLRAVFDLKTTDMPLKPGDELLVQQASDWHPPRHIEVLGEVMRPGPYSIYDGERLASVLEASGGFRADAYPRAAIFTRKSIKELQQQELEQARSRLQQDVARLALLPRQAGQADNNVQTLDAIRDVLSQTESQQAIGRMVIHIAAIDSLERSPDNIVLENEDRLVIPTQPAAVLVLGQVYNPNAIVFRPSLTVMDYLQKAGGVTEGGDMDHIYVVKADGSVVTDLGVRDSEKNRLFPLLPSISGGLMGIHLEPGDTVFVPEKLLFISPLQYVKDISQVIANFATGLAVIGILGATI